MENVNKDQIVKTAIGFAVTLGVVYAFFWAAGKGLSAGKSTS